MPAAERAKHYEHKFYAWGIYFPVLNIFEDL
jgi:hypothetical protein